MNSNPQHFLLQSEGRLIPGHGEFPFPGNYQVRVGDAFRSRQIQAIHIRNIVPLTITLPDKNILTLTTPWTADEDDAHQTHRASGTLLIDVFVTADGKNYVFRKSRVLLTIQAVPGMTLRRCTILDSPIPLQSIVVPKGTANRVAGKSRKRKDRKNRKSRKNNSGISLGMP